jgi:hypothetical protein
MISMILASLMLSVSPVASSTTKLLEHVPLQWRPTSDLRLGTTQMTASPVVVATFTDNRDNRAIIGENSEDKELKPVTTTDDVGAFVSMHIRQLFDEAGIKTVDSNGAVVNTVSSMLQAADFQKAVSGHAMGSGT